MKLKNQVWKNLFFLGQNVNLERQKHPFYRDWNQNGWSHLVANENKLDKYMSIGPALVELWKDEFEKLSLEKLKLVFWHLKFV